MPRTPSDATARLVFADWLTDRDDPRGEWLRVRTQLALGNGTAAELTHLEERERELAPTVLADWFALDLPMWCLLGGGLRYPPVPERLAEENVASWYGMSDFYAGLPEPWGYTRSLQQFVSAVAQTEIAKLFGAEQEDDEVTLVVLDTGFHTRGVYAWVVPFPDTPRFRLGYVAPIPLPRYGPPNESESVSTQCDDPVALRAHFARLLARLWCDTRGLMSVYEM